MVVEVVVAYFGIAPNVLWLCVCLPLAQSFKLPQILMGQIAQNRCYTLGGIIAQMLNWNTELRFY